MSIYFNECLKRLTHFIQDSRPDPIIPVGNFLYDLERPQSLLSQIGTQRLLMSPHFLYTLI
jgi:hypothetical protein